MEEAPDYSQIHETVVSDAEPTAHDVQPTKAPSLAEERDVLSHDMTISNRLKSNKAVWLSNSVMKQQCRA